MHYRTKTYIAADWDNDIDAVEKLKEWNDKGYYLLEFVDVHEYVQARDSSQYCSIKQSLSKRMSMCKTFILIVGNHTKNIIKGSCSICDKKLSCQSSHNSDSRSYIEYECELAVKSNLKIVVLYNSEKINKDLCPEIVRNIGEHVAMKRQGVFYYPVVLNVIRN